MSQYINYALDVSQENNEALWKIQIIDPLDAGKLLTGYIGMEGQTVPTEYNGIITTEAGPHLQEVLSILYQSIQGYPYTWPWESQPINQFSYDFTADISDGLISSIELSDMAYTIIKNKISVPGAPPSEDILDPNNPEFLAPGGVYVKLQVTLDRTQPVSQISIQPFTKYPMEIASISYVQDDKNFSQRKELLLSNPPEPSTGTQIITFPQIVARIIWIILHQPNYEKDTYLVDNNYKRYQSSNNFSTDNGSVKQLLWDEISARDTEILLDPNNATVTPISQSQVNSLDGWDIYQDALAKYNQEVEEWKKQVSDYQNWLKQKTDIENQNAQLAANYQHDLDQYNADYNAAVANYQAEMQSYQDNVTSYNSRYAAYQQQLAAYNQYRRDMSAWMSQWG